MEASSLADSKRCHSPGEDAVAVRKRARFAPHDALRLDLLCDNSLLHVLSFSDLVSKVRLTQCTTRGLKGRFDPAASAADEDPCRAIWRQIAEDIAGRDEGGSFARPLATIDYHMRLMRAAITPGVIKKHQFSLMPLPASWKFSGLNFRRANVPFEDSERELEILYPFGLVPSGIGTGGGYVIIDPETHQLSVGENILEMAICLDSDRQKKRAASSTYKGLATLEHTIREYVRPTMKQPLLESMGHSARNERLESDWDDYFGARSPYRDRAIARGPIKTLLSSISTGEDGRVFLVRAIYPGSISETVCMELLVYGHSPRITSNGFTLSHTFRLAGFFSGAEIARNHVYVIRERGDNAEEGFEKAIYQYPLVEADNSDNQGRIAEFYPECSAVFRTQHPVTVPLHINGQLYIGTSTGTIEVWDIERRECLDFITSAMNSVANELTDMLYLDSSRKDLGYVTEQKNDMKGAVFSFWLRDDVDQGFSISATLTYVNCFPEICCAGERVFLVTYDDFGNLYLDVYLIQIHRHSDNLIESLDTRLPDNVTLFHPESAAKSFRFAQRIDLDQRVTVQQSNVSGAYMSEVIQIDANRRLLTVNLHRGMDAGNLLNPSTDHTPRSGPGILVIDFDVEGFGLWTGKGGDVL
ncbi:hypothetical protein THAOC_32176 [Thalassiosira oceanica]|uniref:Uncharacterized protein n=1 Tax=Thalassiosira oceanica TaxID=159749 RepID=K0RQJ8_THAOC|nr:hypothetical protein THAOC_32176 [Thalassiosira oceanica]|eukprot:EJK48987.1 hypothetical protein THAOC_32176 [Thalassiosira oceanica]